jgi:hypothetical protein
MPRHAVARLHSQAGTGQQNVDIRKEVLSCRQRELPSTAPSQGWP